VVKYCGKDWSYHDVEGAGHGRTEQGHSGTDKKDNSAVNIL